MNFKKNTTFHKKSVKQCMKHLLFNFDNCNLNNNNNNNSNGNNNNKKNLVNIFFNMHIIFYNILYSGPFQTHLPNFHSVGFQLNALAFLFQCTVCVI